MKRWVRKLLRRKPPYRTYSADTSFSVALPAWVQPGDLIVVTQVAPKEDQ